MAKNIEMNVLNESGQYETLWPNVGANSVVDFSGDNPLLSDSVKSLFGLNKNTVPNNVFEELSKSILYSGETEHIYLSDLEQGKEFIIYGTKFIKITDNYNNNSNYTLVLFPKIEETVQWSNASNGSYAGETLDTYLENTFYNNLPESTKSNLLSVNIKCYSGANKSSALTEIQRKVFAPSFAELYDSSLTSDGNFIPGALEVLLQHQDNAVWLRTPNTNAEAYRNTKPSGTYRSDAKTDTSWFSAFAVLNSNTLIENKYLNLSYNLPNGNIVPIIKIETGSYVGTGTYGEDNPTSITFSIDAQVLFISAITDSTNERNGFAIFIKGIVGGQYFYGSSYTNLTEGSVIQLYQTTEGNIWNFYTVKNSGSPAAYQCNYRDITYMYMAIGF